ncbi:MAG: glycosyl transferase [Chromatiales bacterium 21-64-14]|nr:MAG: glycosyl transferase [Chromatiales bacterium 21-64-14]HQU17136.1 TIGR04283 family arsenosugar biosynthesis glycosyltransferase [Gammaproteobacteria bacterium]
MERISIIVPARDESAIIAESLAGLAQWRQAGHEVIVVDGDSHDDTAVRARPLADHVLRSPAGRALQMNAGARVATGSVLLFLHADTRLPPDADQILLAGLVRSARLWGRFDVRLSGTAPVFRLIGCLMNLRSRWTGIATGDQALFVRRDTFLELGGYVEQPLMEDVDLSRRLKRRGPPLCLHERVVTSSRRWEQQGVVRTVLGMWWRRLAYALGTDPRQLVRGYHPNG